MDLTAGTTIGQYEILARLGAGGMGEVYRARDTRLGREVAIKAVLPALLRNPEALRRFESEGRLLASLNHPNIASIYDIDEVDGEHFIVLELVPGETLAERFARGPVPLGEMQQIGAQVADALEAAHQSSIIHRDLKPANIKITPSGRIKVLDFGLAKSAPVEVSEAAATLVRDSTRAGLVLGTPQYMSPEQARGLPVDKRTDIWALGCILFEGLSGHRGFDGDTPTDVVAAVLHETPRWDQLPRKTPARVRLLLRRCLEKDREARLADAGEVGRVLRAADDGGGRRRLMIAAAAALVVVIAAIILMRRSDHAASTQPPRFRETQLTVVPGIEDFPAWSPDGKRLAYAAEAGAVRKIFVRTIGATTETQLTRGEYDDQRPVWSADGHRVLFERGRVAGQRLEPGDVFGQDDGGDIWSIDETTGKESRLLENAFSPSLSADGKHVAFDASWGGPRRVWIADELGHNPRQLTNDTTEAAAHTVPRWSPDGTKIAFQRTERTKFDISVVDVRTGALVAVTDDLAQDIAPAWDPSGKTIYFSSYRSGGLNIWRIDVDPAGRPVGKPQQVTSGAGQDVNVAVAGDGKRIAFATLRQNADLWRLPVSPATGQGAGPAVALVATTREDSRGEWSPDDKTVAFNSDRGGEMNLWTMAVGGGQARQITSGGGGDFQPTWSPDGKRLVFFSSRSGNPDIWTVDLESGKLKQLTNAPSIEINPFYSPDGTKIAYHSDQGGRLELWVMNADGSARRALTTEGVLGHFARWTSDGQFIVFRCSCNGKPVVQKVPVGGGEPISLGEIAGGSHISLSPDGSRIMDVVGHKVLWVSELGAGKPVKVFQFDDPAARIDYPVWSHDGHWVLFDRFKPEGGDLWMLEPEK